MLLQSVTGLTKRDRTSITIFDRNDKVLTNIIMCDKCYQQLRIFLVLSTLLLPKSFPIPLGSINHRVSSVLFFPIFSYFLKNSYFFLFFSNFFRLSYYFSQKLKEPSEIRRISCLGKSHSCEIASLWSFPPKSSHESRAECSYIRS